MEIDIIDAKTGDDYQVEIDQNESISTILDRIADINGLQRDGLRLFFRDKFLNEAFTYASCGIEQNGVLLLYSPHLKYEEKPCQLQNPNISLGYQLVSGNP